MGTNRPCDPLRQNLPVVHTHLDVRNGGMSDGGPPRNRDGPPSLHAQASALILLPRTSSRSIAASGMLVPGG